MEYGPIILEKITGINNHLSKIDSRLDGIDDRLDGIVTRLDGIDDRLEGIDDRLDNIDDRLGTVEVKIDALQDVVFEMKDEMTTFATKDQITELERKMTHEFALQAGILQNHEHERIAMVARQDRFETSLQDIQNRFQTQK
jgi:chromosome segregation ATPase